MFIINLSSKREAEQKKSSPKIENSCEFFADSDLMATYREFDVGTLKN